MSIREEVHEMVEQLAEGDLLTVKRLLQDILHPGDQAAPGGLPAFLASCPEDDEPYTEEEQREDAERLARHERGGTERIPHEEMLRRGRKQAA